MQLDLARERLASTEGRDAPTSMSTSTFGGPGRCSTRPPQRHREPSPSCATDPLYPPAPLDQGLEPGHHPRRPQRRATRLRAEVPCALPPVETIAYFCVAELLTNVASTAGHQAEWCRRRRRPPRPRPGPRRRRATASARRGDGLGRHGGPRKPARRPRRPAARPVGAVGPSVRRRNADAAPVGPDDGRGRRALVPGGGLSGSPSGCVRSRRMEIASPSGGRPS